MKLFTKSQIKRWDQHTLEMESISGLDLMERAAERASEYLLKFVPSSLYQIVCGKGNNGGDGLAIARILAINHKIIELYIVEEGTSSEENIINLKRLPSSIKTRFIKNKGDFILINKGVIIDCLLGSGFHLPLSALMNETIQKINQAEVPIISIDIPSGMMPDGPDKDQLRDQLKETEKTSGKSTSMECIKASMTLSFEVPKLSALIPGTGENFGELICLPIGLDKEFAQKEESLFYFTERTDAINLLRKRNKFGYKGDFGHSLMIAGSLGQAGAALLSSSACVGSGSGLVTILTPELNRDILQSQVPEALWLEGGGEKMIEKIPLTSFDKYNAIGLGPGLGTSLNTTKVIQHLIKTIGKPLVLDADALNILSTMVGWKAFLPKGSILTPHVGEFNRLMEGGSQNPYKRLEMARNLSHQINSVIVLKGAYTAVISPSKEVYFNSTGNPGMATGGSGDVLTGIITALMAQGYPALEAARLGVYIHGMAGDFGKEIKGETGLRATVMINNLGKAFRDLEIAKNPFLP